MNIEGLNEIFSAFFPGKIAHFDADDFLGMYKIVCDEQDDPIYLNNRKLTKACLDGILKKYMLDAIFRKWENNEVIIYD